MIILFFRKNSLSSNMNLLFIYFIKIGSIEVFIYENKKYIYFFQDLFKLKRYSNMHEIIIKTLYR